MKLILDKNFVQETEKYTKEQDKALKFKGWTADWEEIELVDMENESIAPMVRFLAQGKKKKISWLLIWGAGLLMLIFFGLMIFLLMGSSTTSQPTREVIQPIQKVTESKPDIEVIKTETENETSWALEIANEIDMFEDMKDSAELEAVKLNYEVERLKVEVEEKTKANEKLTNMVNNLEAELNILSTRKSEGATDDFIYYLWDSIYKRCEQPTTDLAIEKCKTLYFNYLEHAKNR